MRFAVSSRMSGGRFYKLSMFLRICRVRSKHVASGTDTPLLTKVAVLTTASTNPSRAELQSRQRKTKTAPIEASLRTMVAHKDTPAFAQGVVLAL